MSGPSEKALQILKYLPRVSLENLVKNPYLKEKKHGKKTSDFRKDKAINKSNRERRRFWPVGYEGGRTPFYMKIPIENYYKNFKHRRQYPPLSLYELQLMIDNGVIDPEHPIDLASLCNSQFFKIDPYLRHFGVHLTGDNGLDIFNSKINIEVQHTSEPVIAAIEKNGGRITTSYFDIKSVMALCNPLEFFKKGEPIPKRGLPPMDAYEYYSNPKNRGYLAKPEDIERERMLLAQKYGYELPKNDDPMMKIQKHKRQIFFGLEPGWLINLRDKEILKPTDPDYIEYYQN